MKQLPAYLSTTLLTFIIFTVFSSNVSANITTSYSPNPIAFDQPVTFTINGCKPGSPIDTTFDYPGGSIYGTNLAQVNGSGVGTFERSFVKRSWWRFDLSCVSADSGNIERVDNIPINIPPLPAINVSIEPNPPPPDTNTKIIATGCPANSSVEFRVFGVKPGPNITKNFNGTVTADSNGIATYANTGYPVDYIYKVDIICGGETYNDIFQFTPSGSTRPTVAFITQPPPPPPLCATGGFVDGKCVKVDTAIGEINTDGPGFIYSVFTIILSLSGGVLLLSIIYAGYLLMMSRGEPEKVQKGKELLTSSIVGFLFILFSYIIFGVITVDILKLPGFSN